MYSAMKLKSVSHFLDYENYFPLQFFLTHEKTFSFLVDTAVLELIQLVPPGIVSVSS